MKLLDRLALKLGYVPVRPPIPKDTRTVRDFTYEQRAAGDRNKLPLIDQMQYHWWRVWDRAKEGYAGNDAAGFNRFMRMLHHGQLILLQVRDIGSAPRDRSIAIRAKRWDTQTDGFDERWFYGCRWAHIAPGYAKWSGLPENWRPVAWTELP